ncbi:MAG: hypothetical protein PHH60_02425 [Candidatus Margulisbacteria bacterium]|nr:hypothetical protein [Candidatus Margulisiibacteriota bacterium]
MPLSNLDLKKVYYYVLCVMAFFVLMWGVVDLASSSLGLYTVRGNDQAVSLPADAEGIAPPSDKGEQLFDVYYQKKMLYDRFWDSLARVIIAGAIFAYCRITVNKLEA